MSRNTKHLSGEERRAGTIETVIDLASEQNPEEITTTAIANRMGLSQGALFRHFPNKEAILKGVIEWVAERLLSRVDKAAKEASSPLAALEAVFGTHIDFVASHPGAPRMLFGELQRSKATPAKRMARTLIENYAMRIEGIIEEGKAQGEIDALLDSKSAATMFVGIIQGLVMQSLIAGKMDNMRENASGVFKIYRRGIVSTL
ncbi:TetR/AcrR family transcriptional regulator [Mariprofundus ferrooxydans]|uniref:TetR/AcrR family transcriptional regulator n=1 Tax=Mariprofundus ferrooxydans TaxID=314344 RepID=UPI00036AB542|nr:TetR/AcrR family transcriptional regulator [Mariprofundus ferrooxydans]